MGGNRFKDEGAVRLSRPAALFEADRILKALRPVAVPTARIELAGSLRNKSSFGDLDFVVSPAFFEGLADAGVAAALERLYGTPVRFHRGDCKDPTLGVLISTVQGPFHVDFITAQDESFDFALRYMSAGDAGMLVGRIARQMGCKFGQYGLAVLVGHGTKRLGRVVLTTDFDEALEFLGFDPAIHAAGFDDEQAVRSFIMSSPWYDPGIYDPSRITNESRRRALKRPQYLEHVEHFMRTPHDGHVWPTLGGEDQMLDWRRRVLERFPHARAAVEAIEARERTARRLTGAMITEMTGIADPVLRHLINAVAKEFPLRKLYVEWTDTAEMDQIASRFMHYVANPTSDMTRANAPGEPE